MDKRKDKKRRPRRAIFFNRIRTVGILLIIALVCVGSLINDLKPKQPDISYPEFLEMAKAGEVKEAQLFSTTREYFTITTVDGETHRVPSPNNDTFKLEVMQLVDVQLVTDTTFAIITGSILRFVLFILLYFMVMYVLRMAWDTGVGVLKPVTKKKKGGVTFEDVAGIGEIREEIQFVVELLKNYDKFSESGVRVPKGILLYGPSGTGKTLIARAIAGEADVPFFAVAGSDFSDMFVGQGAKRVRSLCTLAETNAPCVVFIDEIDSVGAKRKYNSDVAHEFSSTLNALLSRMDGLTTREGVLFIAATNRLDELDPALLRAGRFDRHIRVSEPVSRVARDEIIAVHLRGKKLEEGLTVNDISIYFKGMTGASIANILNEATIESLIDNREGVINVADIDKAVTKFLLQGVITVSKNKKLIDLAALHEAGHAIVAKYKGYCVRKVTVNGAGASGGATMIDTGEDEDLPLLYATDIRNRVAFMYGGCLAERIVNGEHSQGCDGDLSNATKLLEGYVKAYGMYDTLLTISDTSLDFDNYSQSKLIQLAKECEQDALSVLELHKEELLKLRDRLVAERTIYNYQ